jgi:hypothetical protein
MILEFGCGLWGVGFSSLIPFSDVSYILFPLPSADFFGKKKN